MCFNKSDLVANRVNEEIGNYYVHSAQHVLYNATLEFLQKYNLKFEPFSFELGFSSASNDEGGSYEYIDSCFITSRDGTSLNEVVEESDMTEDDKDYWMENNIIGGVPIYERFNSFDTDEMQDDFDLKAQLLGILNNEF